MKKNILFIIYLTSFFSFSQEIQETFNGEIHTVYKKVFHDMETYLQDVEHYLNVSDSVMKIQYKNNPNNWDTSLEKFLEDKRTLKKMLLEPNFIGEDWQRQKSQRWIFTDTIISIYGSYGKPLILDRMTGIYTNRTRHSGNGTVKEYIKHKFVVKPFEDIIIDKNDIKQIAGLECFKVTVKYNDERFEKLKNTKHKIIYEMYVTGKIKTKYNPFIRDLSILNQFYPMYVKKYATAFRGRYSENQIVLFTDENNSNKVQLEISYEYLKDSLLSNFKNIVSINKVKEKGFVPIIQNIKKRPVPFEKQLSVLESLGYKFNPKITHKDVERELIVNGIIDTSKTTMKSYFTENPYSELYLFMGWSKYDYKRKKAIQFNDKCFLYSLDYLGIDVEYIALVKRMGKISDGELLFSNMKVTVDADNNQWISFQVNGKHKNWKLAKVNYIDDSFISRFTLLTKEFNTKGKFTYLGTDGESFLIDYATPQEQKEFNQKTGLQREWLTSGKHFSEPKD